MCGGDCHWAEKHWTKTTAWAHFARAQEEYMNATDGGAAVDVILERWNALDDAGKKPFYDLAAADPKEHCAPKPVVWVTVYIAVPIVRYITY